MEAMNLPDTFSLLWPEGGDPSPDSDRPCWGERTQADLGIESLAGYLSPDPRYTPSILSFLLPLTTDTDIIRYRQEVLEDFLHIPEVAAVFESLQAPLLEIERLGGPPPGGQTSLQKILYRMGELELYVDCIEKLWAALSANRGKLKSAGLLQLLEYLSGVRGGQAFLTMARELPNLRARYDNIAGISIGVNLDEGLRPIGATLLSIRHKPFTNGTFLSKLFGKDSREDEQGIAPLHELPFKRLYGPLGSMESFTREAPELYPLFKDLDIILKDITKPIAQILTQYLQVNTRPLAGLGDEVVFYLNGARMMKRLLAAGLPVCRPEIAPMANASASSTASTTSTWPWTCWRRRGRNPWPNPSSATASISAGRAGSSSSPAPIAAGKPFSPGPSGWRRSCSRRVCSCPAPVRGSARWRESSRTSRPRNNRTWMPGAWARKPAGSTTSSAESPATAWCS